MQGADRGRAAAVMLQGGQGTGKTALSDLAARIYGSAYLRVANADHLTGRCNVHLADKMFVGSEEAIFVGDRKAQDALKNLITGHVLTAEAKFGAVIQAPNHIRLLMTTNASHAVHLEGDNRRIAVFQTGPKMPAAHYAALFSEIKGDGAAAFLNMLRRMDLSGFREQEDIPRTRARAEQKLASLAGVERWWEMKLRSAGAGGGGFGGPSDWFAGNPVASATVFADYEDTARRGGERIVPPVLFWKTLRTITDVTKSRPRARPGAQVPSVIFPSLPDARAAFEAALGIRDSVEWDE